MIKFQMSNKIKFFWLRILNIGNWKLKIPARRQAGFSLLEILITFAIIAILSLIGIASFISFNRAQILNVATSDFVSALNLAKSRASSQVKTCTTTLNAYKLGICPDNCESPENVKNYSYAVYEICNNTSEPAIFGKKLPDNMTFTKTTGAGYFLFKIMAGGVEFSGVNPAKITVNGYNNNSKVIEIYSDGRIVSN